MSQRDMTCESRTTEAQWSLFHWNLGLGRQIEQISSKAFWGILGQTIITHFGIVSLLFIFPLLMYNDYFYKKLSLYIHIQNIFLGLGFELGSQRIRVWVQFNVPFSQLLLLLDVILTYCAGCYLDLFVTPGQWMETESILDQGIVMDTFACIMKYARAQVGLL